MFSKPVVLLKIARMSLRLMILLNLRGRMRMRMRLLAVLRILQILKKNMKMVISII